MGGEPRRRDYHAAGVAVAGMRRDKNLMVPIDRSAIGLRDALFDEIDALRGGHVSTGHARAIAMLARQVVDVARLELIQRRLLEATKRDEALLLSQK